MDAKHSRVGEQRESAWLDVDIWGCKSSPSIHSSTQRASLLQSSRSNAHNLECFIRERDGGRRTVCLSVLHELIDPTGNNGL